jgi:hypothetical protein
VPAYRADFDLERDRSGLSALGGYTLASGTEDLLAAEVLIIRVEVQVDSDLKALPSTPSGVPRQTSRPNADVINEGLGILRETFKLAREFAERYIALVRTEADQYWLGPSESRLYQTWLTQLIDGDGRTIPVGYGEPGPVYMLTIESALTGEVHAALVRNASVGTEPNLADKFLSDAEYAAFAASSPHLRQATLLAAIACEVKVKETITIAASPEQQLLVDLLLENPRD